jgi:DNA mismatch endonuclease, patch repair protein
MVRKQALNRSANMARIRGRDTTPELTLRKALWRCGLRFRVHLRVEGTRPDIAFPSRKLVIFVDGCFWHGCPQHYVRPRSRSPFWDEKLRSNTLRDRQQTTSLLEKGWSVLRFWEHEVEHDLPRVVAAVVCAYRDSAVAFEQRTVVVRVEPASADGVTERWHINEMLGRSESQEELRTRGKAGRSA